MSEERKYVVAWMDCRPGKRDEFLEALVDFAPACLAEEGCLRFEYFPSQSNPDQVFFLECFASQAAHDQHMTQPHAQAFFGVMAATCLSCQMDTVFARSVSADTMTFGG